MLARIRSAGTYGVEAYPVEVEVNVAKSDFAAPAIVGLPDTTVKESVERVHAALLAVAGVPVPRYVSVYRGRLW